MAEESIESLVIEEKAKFEDFISNFEDAEGTKKYKEILQKVSERKLKEINIELEDIRKHTADDTFIERIVRNTRFYHIIFADVIDQIMPPTPISIIPDAFDVLKRTTEQHHRDHLARVQGHTDGNQQQQQANMFVFPKELQRRYDLHLIPPPNFYDLKMRQILSEHIGHLIRLRGIITRVSDVKPMLQVATYVCEKCNYEVFQEIRSTAYTPISTCPSPVCKGRKVAGDLNFKARGSKFIRYQEARIQEVADEVPIGHIPRSMTVHLSGELCRSVSPGDFVRISGTFMPTTYSSGRRAGGGSHNSLLSNVFIETTFIEHFKESYTTFQITDELKAQVQQVSSEGNAYSRIAKSLAPEIFGQENIKKALVLLMVSGVPRTIQDDGMKIRGDMHVLLMGDPGTAKSQLLKHTASVSPRSIYTSGKGSSGVGLTAAVLKDPVSNELLLEGGSLVLADNGICCIDEFDKMDESDRTAIHEVMEHQQISIAKAGITTTLNARTSVLAAANPAFGRYHTGRSVSANINLPAALLSRFDLLFLLLDKPDMNMDRELAKHITTVHQTRKPPQPQGEAASLVLPVQLIRAYISECKQKMDVYVPKELRDDIVSMYTNLRKEESSNEEFMYTTARSLLAILRLSTALARLRFDSKVSRQDIEEAVRLMHESKSSIREDRKSKAADPVSVIYEIIREMIVQSGYKPVKKSDVLTRVIHKGYTEQQLNKCLEEFESYNVLSLGEDGETIRYVQG